MILLRFYFGRLKFYLCMFYIVWDVFLIIISGRLYSDYLQLLLTLDSTNDLPQTRDRSPRTERQQNQCTQLTVAQLCHQTSSRDAHSLCEADHQRRMESAYWLTLFLGAITPPLWSKNSWKHAAEPQRRTRNSRFITTKDTHIQSLELSATERSPRWLKQRHRQLI